MPTRRPLIVRAGQGLLCADYKIAVRRKLPSISCQAQRTSTLRPTGGQTEQARRCVRERERKSGRWSGPTGGSALLLSVSASSSGPAAVDLEAACE